MKRLSLLLLTCLFILSMTACGNSGTQTPLADGSTSLQDNTAVENGSQTVIIEPDTVLIDQDGIKITAKELEDDSIWGLGVKLLIENNSEKGRNISCSSLVVNGYMIDDLFTTTVAAGKKSNETVNLSSAELNAAGIETVSEIALIFCVSDSETYRTEFYTDEVVITTSAYGSVEQPALDDGIELVNRDGVRIVGRYVDEDSFWGAGILLFIENERDHRILVDCDDMSINGFMVTPYFSSSINGGRMRIDDITILSSDLEKNGIEKLESIEMEFRIIDPDTYGTIFETGPVSFEIES